MSESVTGHAVRSVRAFFAGRMPSGSELVRAVVAMTFTSAIGTLTGHPLLGVYLAIGALWGITQDLPKPLGRRAIRLLVTATASGLGTVIGVLAAEDGATPVRGAVLVAVAVLSGVASGSGLLWSVAALQLLLGTIVASGMPPEPHWWLPAIALFAGGLIPLVLGIVTEAVERLFNRSPDGAHPVATPSTLEAQPGRPDFMARLRFGMLLGACLLAAIGIEGLTGGPHGFWLPLTVAFIYKPDFGPVLGRALHRCVGTVIGAAAAAASALALTDDPIIRLLAIALAAIVLAVGARTAYGLATAGLTTIVFGLNASLGPLTGLPTARVRDTLLAAAVVVLAELVIGVEAPQVRRYARAVRPALPIRHAKRTRRWPRV
jgi:hypothetical protein